MTVATRKRHRFHRFVLTGLVSFVAVLGGGLLASFLGSLAHAQLGSSVAFTNTAAGIAVWMIASASIACLMLGGLVMLSKLAMRHVSKSEGSSDDAA
jgi:hypothetical protein